MRHNNLEYCMYGVPLLSSATQQILLLWKGEKAYLTEVTITMPDLQAIPNLSAVNVPAIVSAAWLSFSCCH